MSTTQIYSNGSALYNNGKVAISKDLVFGLSVFTDNGWMPLKTLQRKELALVRQLIDNDPLFLWKEGFDVACALAAEKKLFSISTDGSRPVTDTGERTPTSERQFLNDMATSEYLAMRDGDYRKLRATADVNRETGDISFTDGRNLYAVAKKTGEGYTVHQPTWDGELKPYARLKSFEDLYAHILKKFW